MSSPLERYFRHRGGASAAFAPTPFDNSQEHAVYTKNRGEWGLTPEQMPFENFAQV